MPLGSVFVTDPALLAERTSARRIKGQKGWDKVLLGIYGTLTPLVIPLEAMYSPNSYALHASPPLTNKEDKKTTSA